MRRLVLIISFICISCLAFAQKAKSEGAIAKITEKNGNERAHSFVIVDGKIYAGSLSKLRQAEISEVKLLHDTLENMCSNCYRSTILKINTKAYVKKSSTQPAGGNINPIYILNGRIVNDGSTYLPGGTNADSVLSAVYFNSPSGDKHNSDGSRYGAYVMVTKQFARDQYQKKIGAYSPDYRHYLNRKGGDDRGVYYTVGNRFVGEDPVLQTSLLGAVPENNINMVLFTETYMDKGKNCTVCFISIKRRNKN